LREKFDCREGLLIDFDYGVELGSEEILDLDNQEEEADDLQDEFGDQGTNETMRNNVNVEKVSGLRTVILSVC
jgi:hypothetical protein